MRGFGAAGGVFARATGLVVAMSFCALFALCAFCLQADAAIVEIEGRPFAYQPVPSGNGAARSAKPHGNHSGSSPMVKHGGPVMTSNTNYAVYWAPAGSPAFPAGYEAGIDRYFEDVQHDSGSLLTIDSVLSQYTQSNGEAAAYNSTFGGMLLDTDPYPANGCSAARICFTEAQLRSEISAYVSSQGLPTDLKHEYFLITPPEVESCREEEGRKCSDGTSHPFYCAYHNFITSGKGVLIFADIPYVAGLSCDPGGASEADHPNDNPSDAALAGGLVHEHAESVTDPELNAWFNEKKEEVADACQSNNAKAEYGTPLGTAPDGSPYNQLIDGHEYYYQQVWSNEAEACVQRELAVPAVTKIAPKSGPAAGGTTIAITGSGFSAGATVDFEAAGGEITESPKVTYMSSTSITAETPPGAAKSTVYLTVTTSGGTSAAKNKKARFKYKK